MTEQSSQLWCSNFSWTQTKSLPSLLSRLRLSIKSSWYSITQIFHCSFSIKKSSSKSSNTLLSGKSHTDQFSYLCFLCCIELIWLRLRWWLTLLLLFFLLFLLLLCFGWLWLGLFLGFGCRFGNLTHYNNKISFLDSQLLDGIIIVNSFALEYNFECISRHIFRLLDFIL